MSAKAGFAPTIAPIDGAHFKSIAALCLIIGSASTALFFAYQAISTKERLNANRDLLLALTSAVCLGFGIVFSMLSSGVWV